MSLFYSIVIDNFFSFVLFEYPSIKYGLSSLIGDGIYAAFTDFVPHIYGCYFESIRKLNPMSSFFAILLYHIFRKKP
jgi:hypothetical protein